MATEFPFRWESEGDVPASVEDVFAFLDDPRNLAQHMERPSAMMAGAAMRTDIDAQGGHSVGSQIRMSGRMLGLSLSLEEAVVERAPPRHKAWQTFGSPRLFVIGHYRMGFDLTPASDVARLCVWIRYELPSRGLPHWLTRPLARLYARWCTEQMVLTAQQHFGPVAQRR